MSQCGTGNRFRKGALRHESEVMGAIIGTAFLQATSTVTAVNNIPQAPLGHRQPTAEEVQDVQEDHAATLTMKKIDEDLKKKLNAICRGC